MVFCAGDVSLKAVVWPLDRCSCVSSEFGRISSAVDTAGVVGGVCLLRDLLFDGVYPGRDDRAQAKRVSNGGRSEEHWVSCE